MRAILPIMLVALLGTGGSALADEPLDANIAQCIRDNAPKVETAVADLGAAVDFLTTKVCAEPVAKLNAAATKRQQDRMAAQWKGYCDKQKANKDRDDKTASAMANWCEMQNSGGGVGLFVGAEDDESPFLGMINPPAAATALAAQLLLDLRLAHRK